jgi:oxygen-independent coproporphyrinogen-3 oxidase
MRQPLDILPAPSVVPDALPATLVDGLYIHVPFCSNKCGYCDFYSLPDQTGRSMARFVDLCLRELALWVRQSPGPSIRPRSIYLGGGTPTLLPLDLMQRLLRGIPEALDLSCVAEWTIEANPATVSTECAAMLRAYGVDRLSMGAQSFRREDLSQLQRQHVPEAVAASLDVARAAGFRRLSLDLIYAIPGQGVDTWVQTLQAAIALGTDHLSCYNLTYEPATPLSAQRAAGRVVVVDEETELAMLREARDRLSAAGLPPYEISNYARPGQECQHNLLYWNGGNYAGLGPSAASHVDGRRWRDQPDLAAWESAIEAGRLPVVDFEHLSPDRRAGELAMLQLRLSRGIDFADFAARTGYDARQLWPTLLRRLRDLDLILLDERGCRLSPKGVAVADAIGAEFLSAPAPAGPLACS